MADITKEQVIEYIKSMTVLELSELVKELEEIFGVSASAPVMAAMPMAGGGAAAAEEAKTEFDVVLTGFADKARVPLIKVVKTVCGISLNEAKELVDNLPKAIKEGVAKAEADDLKKQLEEAGGTVEVK